MATQDFTLPAAQVAARFGGLLSNAHVERMLSAPNADEALRVLNDLEWASSLAESDSEERIERTIESGLLEIKNQFLHSPQTKILAQYLFLPFDLQNAKSSLFFHVSGGKYEELHGRLSPLGLFPRRLAFSVLEEPTKQRDPTTGFFKNALLAAKTMLEKDPQNPESAEMVLDDAVFAAMRDAVDTINSEPLQAFFRLQIQAENIKYVLRRTQAERSIRYEPTPFLLRLSPNTRSADLNTAIKGTFLETFLSEGKSLVDQGLSLTDWELRLDLAVLDKLYWPSRINPTGPESLVVFFLSKLRNAEVIRTIVVGKQNQLPTATIREIINPYLPYLRKS